MKILSQKQVDLINLIRQAHLTDDELSAVISFAKSVSSKNNGSNKTDACRKQRPTSEH